MLNKGIVSLIIPCYNGEKYIDRCLDCVLAQTYKNIELIIVDDGSTDNSKNMISKKIAVLEKELWKVIFLKQENMGVGAAVNNALKHFTGEYLALLDIDDYMMPEAIMVKVKWLEEHKDYAAVRNNGYRVCEKNFFKDNKLLYEKSYQPESEDMFELIIKGAVFNYPATYMVRSQNWLDRCPDREIYPSRNGQNMQIIMPAVYKGKTGYLGEPLMRYLTQENSLSHFSNDIDGEKAISTTYKYCDIYKNVIVKIADEHERNILLNRVDILFCRKRMNISLKYSNRKTMKEHYNKLKKLKKISLDEYMVYTKLCYPFIEKILSIFHKRDSVYLKVK